MFSKVLFIFSIRFDTNFFVVVSLFPVLHRCVLSIPGAWKVSIHPICSFSRFGLRKLLMSFQPQVPAGPLPMVPEGEMENSKLAEDLLATWMRISEVLSVTAGYFWVM